MFYCYEDMTYMYSKEKKRAEKQGINYDSPNYSRRDTKKVQRFMSAADMKNRLGFINCDKQ